MVDKNSDILRSLGRVEGKVDSVILNQGEHTDRMNRIDQDIEELRSLVFKEIAVVKTDHEKRIATLEKRQYGIFLVGSIIGGLAMSLGKSLGKIFN